MIKKIKVLTLLRKCVPSLLVAGAMASAVNSQAQISATLTDLGYGEFGANIPVVGPDDAYQLTSTFVAQKPDGLNYYFDNGNAPGQTFTTGANPNGYVLTSVSVATAGDGAGLPVNGQAYYLRIYSISGTTATLMGFFKSQDNFVFTDYDWMQWSGITLGLQPNTQYAYTFQRSTSGWENMANITNNPYAGGEVVLIPAAGGTISYGASHNNDAAFAVGLTSATAIVVNPPVAAPTGPLAVGTAVTLSSTPAVGPGTLQYQWKTDGGTGGAMTNIPGANTLTYSPVTTGFAPGVYKYAIEASNGSTAVTSSSLSLVIYSVQGATLVDSGTSMIAAPRDISQLVGGGATPEGAFNYYDNNGNPPGQTFTTGNNSQGYSLSSVKIKMSGGTSGGTATAQQYRLRIYSISDGQATLMAYYTNFVNFSFSYGDWVSWSGLSVDLKPNTTYAYTFQCSSGWAGLGSSASGTDLYPGGQMCLIPANGGAVNFFSDTTRDATFDLGLVVKGASDPMPFANAPTTAALVVPIGAQVTFTESATGDAPLHYIWRTDGGNGGVLTNIPSTDATNLVVNTAGMKAGVYAYNVVVTNFYGASTSTVANLTVYYPETSAILTDIGPANPVPVVDFDQAQLNVDQSVALDNGIIYDTSRDNNPGQIFKTGSNPNGYALTSLALKTGNSSGLPAEGQLYVLRIYSYNEGAINLYAVYNSGTNFAFKDQNWVRWSGLNLPLKPNTSYAYSFGRVSTGAGWTMMPYSIGNLYADGELAEMPRQGGALAFSPGHDFDGTFVVGLAAAGAPVVAPGLVSPAGTVYAGGMVSISAAVSGVGPFTYQWQTDGGVTGTMTNIPGAINAKLNVDTTGMSGLTVAYRLIVSSGSGSTTNEPTVLIISPESAPFIVADTTPLVAQRFVNGSITFAAACDGSAPINYQWQVDKGSGMVDLPGQTNVTLSLSNLKVSDSGSYQLHAVNNLGATNTASATLTVYPQPASPMVVNFQYRSFEGGHDVGVYAGQGVIGAGTYWNQVYGTNNNTSTSPCYADDGVTDSHFGWSFTRNGSWCYTSTPNIALLDNAAEATGVQTFTFYVPDGNYKVVLFSCDGNETDRRESAAIFTLNGETKTTLPTTDATFIENDNYVVFSNVPAKGGTITGTWTSVAGKRFGNLNGAQIQYLGQVSTTPPTMTSLLSNNQLTLSWPADHKGWTLQTQSNATSVGLSNNWVDVPGSSSLTQMTLPVNSTGGCVFYRLIYK